jgi:ADP-ribose pyrophosphatase
MAASISSSNIATLSEALLGSAAGLVGVEPGSRSSDGGPGELREETGLQAADMVKLGYLFKAAIRTRGAIFRPGSSPNRPAISTMRNRASICRRFPACEVMAMIASGQIRDAITVAAIGLLVMRGLPPQAFDLPR